jgi:hypothetical protein
LAISVANIATLSTGFSGYNHPKNLANSDQFAMGSENLAKKL